MSPLHLQKPCFIPNQSIWLIFKGQPLVCTWINFNVSIAVSSIFCEMLTSSEDYILTPGRYMATPCSSKVYFYAVCQVNLTSRDARSTVQTMIFDKSSSASSCFSWAKFRRIQSCSNSTTFFKQLQWNRKQEMGKEKCILALKVTRLVWGEKSYEKPWLFFWLESNTVFH